MKSRRSTQTTHCAAFRGVPYHKRIREKAATRVQYSVGLRDLCAIDVTEAPKRAGGEADLVGGRRVHIENKLSGTQLITHLRQFLVRVCRIRHVLPTGQKLVVTVVGYKSQTENGKFQPSDSVQVRQLVGIDTPFVEIRVVVRYDDTLPSEAR